MLLDDYKLNLSFTLLIQSSSLSNIHHYNYDQKKLYRLIKFLKEERGIGYRRISHILYDKGFRTIRSNKPILNNYVYGIYKTGKIREERLSRSYDSQVQEMRVLNVTVSFFLIFSSWFNLPTCSFLSFVFMHDTKKINIKRLRFDIFIIVYNGMNKRLF